MTTKEARSAVLLQANLLVERARHHDKFILFNDFQAAIDQLIASAVRAEAQPDSLRIQQPDSFLAEEQLKECVDNRGILKESKAEAQPQGKTL